MTASPVPALMRFLTTAGLDLSALEVAEAIWLAGQVAGPRATVDDAGRREPPPAAEEVLEPAPFVPDASSASTGPAVSLPTTSPDGQGVTGFLVRPPDAPAFPDATLVRRALRPLKRTTPSTYQWTVDEAATADFIAATRVWSPVLRPAPERWLDVALIIDGSTGMRIWREMAAEFRSVLAQLGAFRDLRVWHLDTDAGCSLSARPGAAARDAAELVDATQRRLFLVLTDATADAWWNGTGAQILAQWARNAPVAVMQPLPERLWGRTGLPPVAGRLHSRSPAAPNSQLRFTPRRRRRQPAGTADGLPVPVLSIDPRWLAAWARFLTTAGGTNAELPVSHVQAAGHDQSERPAAPDAPTTDPDVLVAQFAATASPSAYKLAICLSVVALSLPVMRIVQHVVLPRSAASTLAEVLLGGLVTANTDGTYDFVPGVRERLHGELRRSEAAAVRAAISAYVAGPGRSVDRTFPAVVHDEHGEQVRVAGSPIARLPGTPTEPTHADGDLAHGVDRDAPVDPGDFVDPGDPVGSGDVGDGGGDPLARVTALCEAQLDRVANYFFARIFMVRPDLRDLFPVQMDTGPRRMLTAILRSASAPDESTPERLEQLGLIHRRFGARPEHHRIVEDALLDSLRWITGPEWTREYDAAWRAAYARMASVMSAAAAANAHQPAFWTAEVVRHERRGGNVAVFTCLPTQPLPYRAGQYVSLEHSRSRMWRNYSIANAPRKDGTLDFHVRALDGGWVSSALVRRLAVGDLVRLGPATGTMGIDRRSTRDIVYVAGGTGLAPIKAMLEDLTRVNRTRWVHVFVGARDRDDFYDLRDLTGLAARHPWMSLVTAVSNDPGYAGEVGPINEVVARYGPWKEHDFYVAGPPGMLRATLTMLQELQVPPFRVKYDAEVLAID